LFCFCFFFFFGVTTSALETRKHYYPSREKKIERGLEPLQEGGGKGEKKKNENVTQVNSCHGPICHIMGTEVSTSINFSSLPRRGGWNGG
jgi:hypothetical protein